MVQQAPPGREGATADMATAATFLASADSAYMTGADLVGGGWMNVRDPLGTGVDRRRRRSLRALARAVLPKPIVIASGPSS